MIKRFLQDRSGAYALMMAAASVPLLLGAGLAVDYARLTQAHSHLQELADGASLTLASSREANKDKLKAMADEFVQANAAPNTFQTVVVDRLDLASKDAVGISLKGRVPMTFMGLANIDAMDVGSFARAVRGMSGAVEVALVLDNTDSMNQDNKIGALKTAATSLVSELFKNKEAQVRVALVPYAEQINVGTKHRKAAWLSVPEDYSKTTTTTTKTGGYWHQATQKTDTCLAWNEAGSKQVEKDGVWVTEKWGKSCKEWKYVNVGEPVWVPESTKTETKTATWKWYGCVGSRVSSGALVLEDGVAGAKYPGFVDRRQYCLTEILPLTDSKSAVDKAVQGMITSRPGYTPQTYIPGGMMWGINVLSPAEPFAEAAAFDDKNAKPRKVIVLMTDGLNTRRVNLSGTLNLDFLKGGGLIGNTNAADAAQRVQTNADTLTLCGHAKARKIEIFTVAFKVDDGPAKAMLQACATDAAHYYDAGNPEALMTAFADIAQSLVKVRLAQ